MTSEKSHSPIRLNTKAFDSRDEGNTASIIADAFIIFFATWTVTHQLSYFLGYTFFQSWMLAIPTSFGCLTLFLLDSKKRNKNLFSKNVPLSLLAALGVGAFLTLFLYRPDADDEHYLGQAILALDFTNSKMKELPGINTGYALTSYDFIRAAFSYLTSTPIIYSFYVVGPIIISTIAIIFEWKIFKLLKINHIGCAFIVFFILMLSWGDVHRSPANLGFVKFFQGKGALVWVAIPAMLFYWLEFNATKDKKALLLLIASAICGVGFSPTGIPIALLMATLFTISSLMYQKSKVGLGKFLLILLVLIIAFIGLGFLITNYFGYHSSGIHSHSGFRQLTNFYDYFVNWEMLHFVLGDTNRFWIALIAILLSPIILKEDSASSALKTYLWACLLVLLIPVSSAIMAQFSANSFSWRWLYTFPFVLCIILMNDYILSLNCSKYFRASVIFCVFGIFITSGPLIVSSYNHTELKFSLHQLPDEKNITLRPAPYFNRTTVLKNSRIVSLVDGRLL